MFAEEAGAGTGQNEMAVGNSAWNVNMRRQRFKCDKFEKVVATHKHKV